MTWTVEVARMGGTVPYTFAFARHATAFKVNQAVTVGGLNLTLSSTSGSVGQHEFGIAQDFAVGQPIQWVVQGIGPSGSAVNRHLYAPFPNDVTLQPGVRYRVIAPRLVGITNTTSLGSVTGMFAEVGDPLVADAYDSLNFTTSTTARQCLGLAVTIRKARSAVPSPIPEVPTEGQLWPRVAV